LHALALRPALVLTNGTAPFIRRSHHLALLRAAPHPLAFRVSIDHPDEARHDAGRGLKNFRKAMEGLRLLHAAGFEVGVTRQATAGEDVRFVEAQFRRLLGKHGLPAELAIAALPDLGALGAAGVPRVSGSANDPAAVVAVAASGRLASPACTRSRMLLARDGAVRVHACPLADDAARFDLGGSLDQAMASRVVPDHPRCSL